ncbi:unnamed protein product [Prunus armeniaca]
MDAEATVPEVPATEEAAADVPDDEVLAVDPTQAIPVEIPSAASVVPTLVVPRSLSRCRPPLVVQPPRSSLSLLAVAVSMPAAPRSQSSTTLTELAAVEAIATDGTTSSDDLEELYASLHEEGGSSASAPLDEDSRAVIQRLREYLFLGVHQMTTTEAFMEFRSCLDTAMALGLLDSAQLDELQAHLAEGEEMIGRYAEANIRMTEGCSLKQELSAIKDQVQPAMARLKENDLVIQRENEELGQVEVHIADL